MSLTQKLEKERTFLMMKPDGVVRGLTGEVLKRIERVGLKIVALKMFWATREDIDEHYPKDDDWLKRIGQKTKTNYEKYGLDVKSLGTEDDKKIGLMVRGWVIEYLTSAPMIKMVIEGPHAVDLIRKMAGNTIPNQAEMGTIRGDFSVDSAVFANRDQRAIFNIIHASETPEEAKHEIEYWFSPEDIHDYERVEENSYKIKKHGK
jgi:nucleoside-diphosphate kinase